jgi:hypothetical protein
MHVRGCTVVNGDSHKPKIEIPCRCQKYLHAQDS